MTDLKDKCGNRYRIRLADGFRMSGTRHCTKSRGHKGLCGKMGKQEKTRRQP